MMNKSSRIGAGLALAFAAVLMAGCSSSDGDNSGTPPVTPAPPPAPTPPAPPAPPPPAPPPPVASADPTVALVRQLVGQGGNDTAEPLVLSDRPFATTDNTEPESI